MMRFQTVKPGLRTRLKVAGRIVALTTFAALSTAASPPASPDLNRSSADPKANWAGQVAVTSNGSHRYGNPNAPVRLVEFVSYTCPHCAHFHKEADPILRLSAVPKGQVSVTVTNLLRNPIDLTVAMLANCGDPKRFFTRHNAFFGTQSVWLVTVQKSTREQQTRWFQGTPVERMRAISNDLGFYTTMEGWGIGRTQVDVCFANKPLMDKLTAQTSEAQALGIQGTPSFTINGEMVDGHDWQSVSAALTAKIAEQRAGNI